MLDYLAVTFFYFIFATTNVKNAENYESSHTTRYQRQRHDRRA